MKTIAITGATGQLGHYVLDSLKARGASETVVALARSQAKAATLGVKVREADYDKPETLVSALGGVESLLLISGNEIGKRSAQHQNVITAAKKAGVKRIVYTSLLHADRSPLSLAEEHRATEAAIREAGLAFVILRNGWYTENYTGSIAGALKAGAFLGSAGNGRISSATRRDFAEAAVAVLTDASHDGRTYELAGDRSYTLAELAAELSRQIGREIPYNDLPAAEYAAILVGAGVPEGFAKAIADWDIGAKDGALYDEGHVLSNLIGRPTTSLAAAISEALGKIS